MNWVDWLIIAFLGFSVIGGFREGFIRISIGFVALIVGFIAATWFYGVAADPLTAWIHSRSLANFAGFGLIFVGVLVLGALLAAILVRVFKLIGLSPVDRLMGACVGFVRGALVLVITTMGVMAFAPNVLPGAVERSELAPYVIRGSRVLTAVAPFDLRDGFNRTFERLQVIIKELRHPQKLIAREE